VVVVEYFCLHARLVQAVLAGHRMNVKGCGAVRDKCDGEAVRVESQWK
jgi:hypothetical protein